MSNELKPCPFCGNKANIYERHDSGLLSLRPFYPLPIIGYIVRCSKCNAKMNGKRERTLIQAWNRRAK